MHKHLIRLIFAGIIVLSIVPVFSQGVYFQRLFTGLDRQTINYGCEPTEDGGFYLLNFFSDETEMRFGLNISRHDHKGNLVWTNDYELDPDLYVVDFRRVDMVNTGKDTLVVSGLSFPDPTGSDGNYILKIEPGNGETVYSGLINNRSGIAGPAFWPKLVNGFHNELNYIGSHIAFDSTFRFHLEKFDRNIDSISSKSFLAIDDDGIPMLTALLDATTSADSASLAVSCIASPDELLESIGLVIIDSSSNITSANKYSIDSIMYSGMQVFGMAATQDTGTVMMGSYVDIITNSANGFVFKADSMGKVEWSKNIGSLTPFSISIPNSCLYTSKNEILIMGKSADLFSGELSDFAIFMDDDGNVLRQKLYSSENSFFLDLSTGLILLSGDLHNSPDGSILYSTTGIDLDNGLVLSPIGIKMDRDGAAVCEDTLNVEVITDISIIRDTLILTEDNVVTHDTTTVVIVPFNDYDLPILTLLDTFFCPQDPVMATLNATLETATSYLWSTGDTTPTLFVTEEGEYQVTVTIDDRICYMLCDTSNISVRDFPEADINPDLTIPCQVTLAPSSTTDIALAVWSTGDTINSLVVTEPGNYSVTITDSCDNQAEASVTIGPGVFTPVIDFSLDDSRLCEFGELLLTATSTIPAAAYIWSTGDTTGTIAVTTPGEYSVTVTDICGEMAETSISFDANSFELDLEAGINRDYSRLCEFTEMRLWAVGTNQIVSYIWSTGETTPNIDITTGGTYSVTVTDICGTTAEVSLGVDISELDTSFDPAIDAGPLANCMVPLTALANNTNFDIISYEWSTGQNTQLIAVGEPGTYTVTITDECGNVDSETINIGANIFDISVSIQSNESCPDTLSILVAPLNANITSVNWSTGESSSTIEVLEGGEYSVTITNDCGEEATASYMTIDTLMWPNIFFPRSEQDLNKTFKPYIPCPELFFGQDYKLEVFNRWGNRVFETTSIAQGWNGNYSGNPAPSGVFMYYASWIDNGESKSAQGDVTLAR